MPALAAWRERDEERAIHPADRAAIASTEAARALVLELLALPDARPSTPERDLYNACAALGRLYADAGASPTLAALTLDGAVAALGTDIDPARLAAARASLVEAYSQGRVDAERLVARRAWEYPACAARLDAETVAIAPGHPEADRETLGDWAARVALAASKDRVKVAILPAGSGSAAAREELAAAFELVGVAVRTELAPRAPGGWLRLPWRK